MEDRPRLLAPAPRISVHLVVGVGAVIKPNRLQAFLGFEQQNHRVFEYVVPLRRELHAEQSPGGVIEDPAVIGAHSSDDRPPGGELFCLQASRYGEASLSSPRELDRREESAPTGWSSRSPGSPESAVGGQDRFGVGRGKPALNYDSASMNSSRSTGSQ
jgi:hypothetical protein